MAYINHGDTKTTKIGNLEVCSRPSRIWRFDGWPELEAGGFGGPPKPTGQRPVLPVASRPNGAAVFQPKASAAPPWETSAPH